MRKTRYVLWFAVAAALTAAAADDTAQRLGQAVTVFDKLTESGHGIGRNNLPTPTV